MRYYRNQKKTRKTKSAWEAKENQENHEILTSQSDINEILKMGNKNRALRKAENSRDANMTIGQQGILIVHDTLK